MNDSLNTFRALQDLPRVVSSFWCRFNLHKWTIWSDPKETDYNTYVEMNRTCVHCNMTSVKRFKK